MGLRVLLAEDESLVAIALADWLEAEGHSVTVTSDGAEAFDALRGLGRVDLLLTDLRMPRPAGEDLIRAVWAERPGMPVLVVTGSAPPDGAAALRRTVGNGGPLALLHKPLDYESLAKALCLLTEPTLA